MGSYCEDLDELTEALAARWTHEPTVLLMNVFPLLAEGSPAPIRKIAEMAHMSEQDALELAQNSRAEISEENEVTSLFGVGFSPSVHSVNLPSARLYTCCGLIAQTLAPLTRQNIEIRSSDPVTEEPIRMNVSPTGIVEYAPKGAVCTFARGKREDIINNPYRTFCRHARFCVSKETADDFVRLENIRFIVSIEESNSAAMKLVRQAWITSPPI